jgi:chromosome partitioning protein
VVYAILNRKGGVGKTTTAVNLGAALARSGKSVLVIDLDPQMNATTWIGVRKEEDDGATIADALEDRSRAPAAVGPSSAAGVDLMYGSELLAIVADDLRVTHPTPALVLRSALKQLKPYDVTIIDCPPGLGLLPVAALVVAQHVVVPVDSKGMAVTGVHQIQKTIDELVAGDVIAQAPETSVLVTMHDRRLTLDRDVEAYLRATDIPTFTTVVRRNISLAECYGLRRTVFDHDASSNGAHDYAALASEMMLVSA